MYKSNFSEKLFSYGTLRNEAVQLANFGRKLIGKPDILFNFALSKIKRKDPNAVAQSGESIHPMINYTGNSADKIEGLVFDISLQELAQADLYELTEYKRIQVQLASGITAWVYVGAAQMNKIIYITDPEILAIPIIECYDPLIDLNNQHQLRYGSPPENEFTSNCYTKMRKTVYQKLCQAQKALPLGWYFRIYEGFRSIKVQKMLFNQKYQKVANSYPNANPPILFRETTRLVSPVINLDGSNNIPAHNTGGAIDLEIINEEGQLIDMGMAAKDWCNVEPELCMTDYQDLNPEVRKNRKILFEVMTNQGFVNYPTEWWHFSYGDRYWAYHKQQKHAIYGAADSLVEELVIG